MSRRLTHFLPSKRAAHPEGQTVRERDTCRTERAGGVKGQQSRSLGAAVEAGSTWRLADRGVSGRADSTQEAGGAPEPERRCRAEMVDEDAGLGRRRATQSLGSWSSAPGHPSYRYGCQIFHILSLSWDNMLTSRALLSSPRRLQVPVTVRPVLQAKMSLPQMTTFNSKLKLSLFEGNSGTRKSTE